MTLECFETLFGDRSVRWTHSYILLLRPEILLRHRPVTGRMAAVHILRYVGAAALEL